MAQLAVKPNLVPAGCEIRGFRFLPEQEKWVFLSGRSWILRVDQEVPAFTFFSQQNNDCQQKDIHCFKTRERP
jgi:hypothetical protein